MKAPSSVAGGRPRDQFPTGLNPDEYWHLLDDFDLTDQQKDELLICLWNVMSSFAATGFGQDPTQYVIPYVGDIIEH